METERSVTQKYETVFCIFLVLIVFLWRENSSLVYPHILYLLLLLLTLNFSAGYLLRFWPDKKWAAASIILANCAAITAILSYSGAYKSNLWILFLLPIYTACILLDLRETILVTCGVLCFNLAFYAFSANTWDAAFLFEIAVKNGLFVFAAAMTWNIVWKGRAGTAKLRAQRQELDLLEEKFKEQEVRAQQTEKIAQVGRIASGVVHDLKNPIMVIMGSVHLLTENGDVAPGMRADLERITRATELCKNIVDQLLLQARKEDFHPVPCDIRELIDSTVSLYERTLSDHRIDVQKDFGNFPIPKISMSRPHIERLLLNLFSNAKAAMRNGGLIKIYVWIVPAFRPGARPQVNITVEDTGPGIPPEALPRLFQAFNTSKPAGEGTGLGLYLCREIALKHGGTLTAKNHPEGGASFTLTLPALEPEAVPVRADLKFTPQENITANPESWGSADIASYHTPRADCAR